MASLSVATYLAVFNLRHIVGIIHGKYLRWKGKAIDQMKNDKRQAWRTMADLLQRSLNSLSQTDRSESEPSAWWIAVYYVMKLLERVGLRNASQDRQTI
jgi:hypothetical protein